MSRKSKSYTTIRRCQQKMRQQRCGLSSNVITSPGDVELSSYEHQVLTSYPSPSASSSWSIPVEEANDAPQQPPTPRWTLAQRKKALHGLTTPTAWKEREEKLGGKLARRVNLGGLKFIVGGPFHVDDKEMAKLAVVNQDKPIDFVEQVAAKFQSRCKKRGYEHPDEDNGLLMALTHEVIIRYGTLSTSSVLKLIQSALKDGLRKRRYAATRREKRHQMEQKIEHTAN